MGIGRTSSPELGTSTEIGWISFSGIGWIPSPELVRDRVCFLGSVLRVRMFFLWPFLPYSAATGRPHGTPLSGHTWFYAGTSSMMGRKVSSKRLSEAGPEIQVRK